MIAINLAYHKNKLYKTLDYWFSVTLNLNFLEKGLGVVSPPYFVYDFSRKRFLMLHSNNWPNFSSYWTKCVLHLFVTTLNLKLTLSSLSSHFATWPKLQDKNLNILRTKKASEVKLKAFFSNFKGLSIAKNCLRPESAPLILQAAISSKIRINLYMSFKSLSKFNINFAFSSTQKQPSEVFY